jgi:hypothetical protein
MCLLMIKTICKSSGSVKCAKRMSDTLIEAHRRDGDVEGWRGEMERKIGVRVVCQRARDEQR